jgi:hypothetical protein
VDISVPDTDSMRNCSCYIVRIDYENTGAKSGDFVEIGIGQTAYRIKIADYHESIFFFNHITGWRFKKYALL